MGGSAKPNATELSATPNRREAAWAAAAARVAPWGFGVERADPRGLDHWLPFVVVPSPDRCTVRAVGEVDGRRLEIVEHDYDWKDSDGNVKHADAVVAILEAPWSVGTAAIAPDEREWSSVVRCVGGGSSRRDPAEARRAPRRHALRRHDRDSPGCRRLLGRSARFDGDGLETTIAHARAIGASFERPDRGAFR